MRALLDRPAAGPRARALRGVDARRDPPERQSRNGGDRHLSHASLAVARSSAAAGLLPNRPVPNLFVVGLVFEHLLIDVLDWLRELVSASGGRQAGPQIRRCLGAGLSYHLCGPWILGGDGKAGDSKLTFVTPVVRAEEGTGSSTKIQRVASRRPAL